MNEEQENPLEVACKLARAFYEPLPPRSWYQQKPLGSCACNQVPAGSGVGAALPKLHLNGEGLTGVVRETYKEALRRTGGHKSAAAELLGIPRQRLYDNIKRFGLGLLLLTTSLASAQPVPPQPTPVVNLAPGLASKPLVLAWDAPMITSNVDGYNIHWGPVLGSLTNIVNVGTNLTVILQNPTTNQFYAATAYDARGVESDFSNVIQPQLLTTTLLNWIAQTNGMTGAAFVDSHSVWIRTNPPLNGQLRLKGEVTVTTKWH